MAKKYDLIADLYAESIREVTAAPENWLAFLHSACRNFRLPFDEQILVHKQRPNASAVLSMQDWNKKFGRWVKRNSHAIAVFDKSGNNVKLKYYFDVSDTKEGRYKRLVRPVPLWEVTDENEEAVKETLSNVFHVSEDITELSAIILNVAENMAEDNLLDYMQDILTYRSDSFIEELDEYSVEVMAKSLLSNSVAYMLMIRCGIDTESYLEIDDFRNIRDFNTPELVNLFGTAISDVSEMALAEISDTMKKLQQKKEPKNHTFAEQDRRRYTEQEKIKKTTERSVEHGRSSVQQEKRLYDTESDRTRRTGSTHWEVWLPSQDVSERSPLRIVYQPDDTRKIESASEGNTGRGSEQNRTDYDRDESSTECDGGIESQRSDDVGGYGKQYPTVSGGNRDERTDFHLEQEHEISPFPSVKEQLANMKQKAEEKPSAFSAPPKEETNTVVYIGMDAYEILSLSEEEAVLQNQMYPLFTEKMPREEFERKVRENPANDHLVVKQKLTKIGEPQPEHLIESAVGIKDEIAHQRFANVQEQGYKPLQEMDLPAEKENVSDLSPAWEKSLPRGKVQSFNLYPEIPQSQRHQFQITDDTLGQGSPKEKFRANIEAIKVLKQCEEENRYATPEEQKVLSGYVGWGGLSEVFDDSKSAWTDEYVELKNILTEEEYEAARESTLTAFYTPPVVIRFMYQALENMGLKSGNMLEPSCAIGNFIGMKPQSLSDCEIYGVEIDSISGRIAGQLYQKSTIAVQGYEEADLPDSFFDVAIGNVPFGQFKVLDKRYDKNNFLVHDYFFAKTLDKVRPGGVIAFITSSGTMDKTNPAIRKYIAQRAELLGAIRLPNDTFQKNAGTEVTADILFLQKRDRMVEAEPDWIYLDTDENGITQNQYFVQHPEMILGEMVMESTQYGLDSTCRPYSEKNLEEQLAEAVAIIEAEITDFETEELVEAEDKSIIANPTVPNFSYTLYEGKIYYRENSRMRPVELSVTATNRVKGMIEIRDCVRELIVYQTEGYSDTVIQEQQKELNALYDRFQSKYGLLNARANSIVFSDDNSYPLLCSLEIVAEDGTLERKADMFTKRTIKPHQVVTRVDTASEALSLSLSEKAIVDMDYMCFLTGKSAEEIEKKLEGVIFRLPDTPGSDPKFVAEDEYLSGNVRKKLKEAVIAAEGNEIYRSNVEALQKVQPKDLTASEISVRLGATWIPPKDIENFIFELLETPNYSKWNIKVRYIKVTGEWNIEGKSVDRGNVKANSMYGTHRANAYRIIEDTLNLRDTRIYDYEEDENGKKKAILNKEETAVAQGKQDLIKQAFLDWIWKEPERRQRLTDYYNEHFNAIRPREYDGSHLHFYGMNPEIQLRQHQKNGVARIIYGGNSLLAYVVGAGKTYTMVAAAMESKRLGLCNKSMMVVPNHIIDQFASEWLQLYPSTNLLVATKKDFETKNRKKFCARIATSDIDAVIIGHSQFEKIPLSVERQQRMIREQIQEVVDGISEAKQNTSDRVTVKRLEKTKKSLKTRLMKLNDQSRKDSVVCFEELGIDRLFVDEADSYKNLYLYTKMRNVGGIAQTEAQKSSDMFMKTRYLDELTGGRGVIFATGTPISNSMVELYTMQRYLQYNSLVESGLQFFDAWASTFGEAVTAIEIAPELEVHKQLQREIR